MIKLYITKCSKKDEHDTGVILAKYALYDAFSLRAELLYAPNGKPYFEGVPAHISISHSFGLCLAAISDSEIGADIEKHRYDTEKLTKLARRYFTKEEAEYVEKAPLLHFYEIWCSKESYIKFTGEGFSKPLSSFSLKDLTLFISTASIDGFTVAVCSKEQIEIKPNLVDVHIDD